MSLESLLSGPGLVALLACLVAAGFYVKQCVLHPLSSYPGPWLASYTNLYAAYHAWRGTVHTDMHRCHEKYGPVVRYGPSRILVNTTSVLKDVFSHGTNATKASAYDVLSHGTPSVITLRNKEEHAWRRRMLSYALSDTTLKTHESIIWKHVEKLCENLRQNAQCEGHEADRGCLDMSRQCDYYTFDVMSEIIFGKEYNALGEPTHRYAIKALADSNVRLGTLFQAPFLAFGRLDKYLFPAAIKGRDKFVGFLGSLLRARSKASVSAAGNVFSFLETAKDKDGGLQLSKSQIRAECAALVVAGSDTSSTALSATLFYLSRHNHAYQRAAGEVRSKFSAASEIRIGPRLNSCLFLRSCIDEAMRMSPPVGGALWREVGAGGIQIDSIRLPAGSEIGIGLYSLHHSQYYHNDPFEYIPERWLAGEGSSTKESVELSRSAFIPFSRGPRSCVGKGFAYHQVTLALARILYEFDFYEADNGRVGDKPRSDGGEKACEYELRDHVTGAKHGPYLRFSRSNLIGASS